MSEISITHDSMDTFDIQSKNTQSTNYSLNSQKKVFYYENLLKVKKNTPRSDMDYLKTKCYSIDSTSETSVINENSKLIENNDEEIQNISNSIELTLKIDQNNIENNIYDQNDKNCNIDDLVKSGEYAIFMGFLPQRIHQGSSGSYFVKDVKDVNYKIIFNLNLGSNCCF